MNACVHMRGRAAAWCAADRPTRRAQAVPAPIPTALLLRWAPWCAAPPICGMIGLGCASQLGIPTVPRAGPHRNGKLDQGQAASRRRELQPALHCYHSPSTAPHRAPNPSRSYREPILHLPGTAPATHIGRTICYLQVLAGPMSSLAEHQLLTGRKIVTHPHYENYRLRQRVHDSYQVTKEYFTCTRLPRADDYLKTCIMAPDRGPNPLLWPHPPRSWPLLRRDSPLPRRARGVGSASADLRSCFAGGRAQDAQRHRSGVRPR